MRIDPAEEAVGAGSAPARMPVRSPFVVLGWAALGKLKHLANVHKMRRPYMERTFLSAAVRQDVRPHKIVLLTRK